MSLNGWNTWDTYSVSSVVYAPIGLRLRAGVVDKNTQEADMEIRLPHMKPGPDLVGPRTADGSYIEWRIQKENFKILLQFTAVDKVIIWRIAPEKWPDNLLLAVDISYPWGNEQAITRSGAMWKTGGFDIAPITRIDSASSDEMMMFDLKEGDAIITAGSSPFSTISQAEVMMVLKQAREACIAGEFQSDGYLHDAARGLSRGAFWNTIWEPVRNRPLPTFSRNWNVSFGGFVDAPADNFAQAASTSLFHKRLAELNIEEMIYEANPEGMIPNIGAANGNSSDRSEPPNGSHSALKIYKTYGDKEFLRWAFPGLAKWNRWWYSHRDGNKDGLMEWGADPITDPDHTYYGESGKQRALWELCADNSVLYDDVEFNEETNTLEMTDVGLNGYLALDAWSLREMARILRYEKEVEEFDRKYNDLKEKINAELWNEEQGIYLDKHWDGRWKLMYEPQLFFPMIAGIVPPERAKRMIEDYFLNETKFWGEYPLPSVSRDNPAFLENSYYRGRIWGEQVHLVTEGLHRYQMDDVAYEFSRRLLKMYLREWEEHSHSHENYNSVTGEGDDVNNATADYAALGGMMAHIAIQQLVDVEAWNGMRFGNLSDDFAKVSNVLIGGSVFEVETGGKLIVRKDGKPYIESDTAVIVRGLPSPAFSQSKIELQLKAAKAGTLKIYGINKDAEVSILPGGEIVSRDRGVLSVRLAL